MSTCKHSVDDRALYPCKQCQIEAVKPVYRIAKISGFWRLMKDDKLHSTYNTQGAAKAGMATEQNRDEARAMKAPVMVYDMQIAEPREIAESMAAIQNWFAIYEKQQESVTRSIAKNQAYRALAKLMVYLV